MNKILSIVLIISFFFASSSFNSKRITSTKSAEKSILGINEDKVFWFFIRVQIDNKEQQYKLMGSGSKLMSGSISEFEQAVWWGISRRQLAVGPFALQNEALISRMFYKKSKEDVDEVPTEDPPSEVYWFFTKFKELSRLGAYQMERMPAAVSSGSVEDFKDALFESITHQDLAIGPYWDYTRAETAKAMYRKNE